MAAICDLAGNKKEGGGVVPDPFNILLWTREEAPDPERLLRLLAKSPVEGGEEKKVYRIIRTLPDRTGLAGFLAGMLAGKREPNRE
jgi:hypothetical protein